MDEAQAIVLDAMERAGVTLPPGVMGVHDIGSAALISIVSQSIALASPSSANPEDVFMPGFVPSSSADRFRVCTRLVELVKQLGYRDDLSFHQFLYPNDTDVHKLLRFLVEKLSKSSAGAFSKGKSRRRLGLLASEKPDTAQPVLVSEPRVDEEAGAVPSSAGTAETDEPSVESARTKEIGKLEQRLALLKEQISELDRDESEKFLMLDKQLEDEAEVTKRFQDKLFLLQESISLVEPGESPATAIHRLRLSSDNSAEALEERKDDRRELRTGSEQHEVQDDDDKHEVEELKAKLRGRQEEQELLTAELEKLPKQQQASRSSYVRRITELVKNSKKQDADVAKIISETRALQRESNVTQERLHRIHALVDELVFRDARKDATCRLAYRLLNRMHAGFADMVDKVLEMDKLDRDTADVQAELVAADKEPVEVAKVQADLDAVRAEKNGAAPELAGRNATQRECDANN